MSGGWAGMGGILSPRRAPTNGCPWPGAPPQIPREARDRIRRMSLDSAQSQRAATTDGSTMAQVMGRRWMIAAGHPLAAQAGARVLAAGGNAIDAGVAAGMTLGVVHPDMVSFAGVAPILVHLAKTGETFELGRASCRDRV